MNLLTLWFAVVWRAVSMDAAVYGIVGAMFALLYAKRNVAVRRRPWMIVGGLASAVLCGALLGFVFHAIPS